MHWAYFLLPDVIRISKICCPESIEEQGPVPRRPEQPPSQRRLHGRGRWPHRPGDAVCGDAYVYVMLSTL